MIKAVKVDPAEYEKMAYLHARRMICLSDFSMQEIEDVKQELLLQLVRAAGAYKPGLASPATFAFAVLQNAAKRLSKQRVTKNADDSEHPRAEHRNDQRQAEMRLDIESAFSKLPELDAGILLELRYATVNEVAAERSMTAREVSELRNRHRETLRKHGLEPANTYRKAVVG